jgi:hypothetical protein
MYTDIEKIAILLFLYFLRFYFFFIFYLLKDELQKFEEKNQLFIQKIIFHFFSIDLY